MSSSRMYDFEKFPVYLNTLEFIKRITPILNNSHIPKHLKDQLDRASTSILLNIAEGAGRYSKNDKKNFYVTARGSAQECSSMLQILQIKGFVTSEVKMDLYSRLIVITKMLSGLINSMIQSKKS